MSDNSGKKIFKEKNLINNNIPQIITNKKIIPFLSIIFIILLVSFLNYPVIITLWRYSFDDGTYSHAYLIPLIVFYLYYILNTENKLVLRTRMPLIPMLLLFVSGYVLFIFANAQISLGYWLALLLLLCTSINLLFETNLKVLFPAFYFIFLLPVWSVLTIPLQIISVNAVNTIMSLTTIPVFVEQQFVHIPEGVFEIAGGCSGLRYLITSLAIGSLYNFLYLRTLKSILLFSSFAILGALLTNWIRIVILIIIGHETNMTSDLMIDHNMFGWYLYIPFMFILFKFGNILTNKTINKHQQKTICSNNLVYPNPKLLMITFTVLAFSSTTISSLFSDNNFSENFTFKSRTNIAPVINFYSSIKKVTSTPEKTYLIYNFNNSDLDNKPTFFDNKLIPQGWRVTAKHEDGQWLKYQLQQGNEKATLLVSYKIDGHYFPTPLKFKIERIKKALLGINKTELYWQFTYRRNNNKRI